MLYFLRHVNYRLQREKVTLKGHLKSLILVSFNRPPDFLLVFHCNYISILYVPFQKYYISVISHNLKISPLMGYLSHADVYSKCFPFAAIK